MTAKKMESTRRLWFICSHGHWCVANVLMKWENIFAKPSMCSQCINDECWEKLFRVSVNSSQASITTIAVTKPYPGLKYTRTDQPSHYGKSRQFARNWICLDQALRLVPSSLHRWHPNLSARKCNKKSSINQKPFQIERWWVQFSVMPVAFW